MPPTRRRSATTASPSTSSSGPDTSAESTVPSPGHHPAAVAADTPTEPTLTIRLPFLTVSLERPAEPSAKASPHAARSSNRLGKLPLPESVGGQRLLFYTGVAALGVAGVVEWPIAAAIAAGTYIAAKSRSAASQPTLEAVPPAQPTS
jgi:hypothetical protein